MKIRDQRFSRKFLRDLRDLASFKNRSEVCKKFSKKKTARQNSNFLNSPNSPFFQQILNSAFRASFFTFILSIF